MTDAADITPPSRPPPARQPEPALPPPPVRQISEHLPASPSTASDIGRVIFWTIVVFSFVSVIIQATTPDRHALAPWQSCNSNLRQLGLAMKMYANTNDSIYPPSWREVAETQEITSDVFICRSHSELDRAIAPTTQAMAAAIVDPSARHCSYTYAAAGLREDTMKDDDVLAFETLPDATDLSVNVLFADTHVEHLDPDERSADAVTYERLRADFAAGIRPLRLRP